MAGTALTILNGLGTLFGGYGAIQNSKAQEEQANYQAKQDEFNAQIAGLQAEDAITRGQAEAQAAGTQAAQLKGQQKAALAGNGVDVSTGSAADIMNETDKLSTLDIVSIKSNAAREAFGYRAQAVGYNSQAEMTRKAGKAAANNTLLTGGANFLAGSARTYGSLEPNAKEKNLNFNDGMKWTGGSGRGGYGASIA